MILTKNKIQSIDIDFEIKERIKKEELSKLLLIVPTNRKARFLKKEIITASPNQSAKKINIETLGSFSNKIFFEKDNIRNTNLSEPALFILLEQVFKECELKYFSNYENRIPTGTLKRINNVIAEYKKHGITYSILREEAEKLTGSEKLKAEDIADIFELFQSKCEELEINDTGDIYKGVNNLDKESFTKRFKSFYQNVDTIIVNGFDEFTLPEINIIDKCSSILGIKLYIYLDYYSNDSIFSHLDKCKTQFVEKDFFTIKEKSTNNNSEFISVIRANLFLQKNKKAKIDFSNQIIKISADNIRNEIELIAKELKNLIQHKQVKPADICLAFNQIQKYSPIVRDVFTSYGIPFNLTDRFVISASPPVISLINILEVMENDFYFKNIFRALNCGYLDELKIDNSSILKSAIKLKIISGYSNWISSLEEEITLIKNTNNYEFESRGNLETFKVALKSLKKIYEILKPFSKELTIDEFKNNFIDLIYILKLPIYLASIGDLEAEKNIKSISSLIEIFNEVIDLLIKEYGTSKKFPLTFYLNSIRTIADTSRYNIKEKPNYGVQVTTLNEIRGLKFDYLFLSGLTDGDFPSRYQPEIFFSGSFFKKEKYHQAKERFQFYQALSSWNKGLYLTYPNNNEKKELVKSNFLTELENIIDVKEKTENDYNEFVYSKEELFSKFGRIKEDRIDEKVGENLNKKEIDEILNSIKIDNKRISEPFGRNNYSGYLSENLNDNMKQELTGYKNKQYSYSQLETYAKCPFKYFVERILKLEAIEEPKEELEFHELGTLLHNILYEFYIKIKSENIILQNCTDEIFTKSFKLLLEIANNQIDKNHLGSPLTFMEKEKILGINGRKENSILYMFLKNEREQTDDFIPEYFEVSFGKFGDESKSEEFHIDELKIDDIKLRGKIDRIELSKDKSKFKVVDYKLSGAKPKKEYLLNGIALQLPLYLYASKELIKTQLKKDSEPVGAEIYSLKYKQGKFGKNMITPSMSRKKNIPEEEIINGYEDLINLCKVKVKEYVNDIIEGKFNLSNLSDRENIICKYCDFKTVCRIQDVN